MGAADAAGSDAAAMDRAVDADTGGGRPCESLTEATMPYELRDVALHPAPMGTRRNVRFVRFGSPHARPKAYVHAGLHANEPPGMLVAHHLLRRLEAAEARGEIEGQVVVAPCANPIGLAQYINGEPAGRHELASGTNFNRGWPDLSAAVARRVDGHLRDDGDANAAIIRQAMRTELDTWTSGCELDALRVALAREACDADIVLDLHCDDDALMHLFLHESQWSMARDLAGELGCRAVLLTGNTGGATFAESCAMSWSGVVSAFPDHPVPQACLAVTVELRGFVDVSDAMAADDAAGLFRDLQRRGHVAGDPGPAPAPPCAPTGLDACDILRAPFAGIVSYHVALGQRVSSGEKIADIIDPSSDAEVGEARCSVRSGTDGVVLSRRLRRLVAADEVVAKVAGTQPLPHRQGYLLED